MAEYGEWNRKGATLSDVTAKAEYGVERDVIVTGIQTDKLVYREGAVWGNPYLRVLRSQLEHYLAEELGEDYLRRVKHHTELRKVKKAVAHLKKQLAGLQKRQQALEASLAHDHASHHGHQPTGSSVRSRVAPVRVAGKQASSTSRMRCPRGEAPARPLLGTF